MTIEKSRLRAEFDQEYYLRSNADLKAEVTDAFQHFMTVGWKEGRNPNRTFNCHAYLRRHIDVAIAGKNPFEHYILHGRAEGREVPSGYEAALEMPAVRASQILQDQNFPASLTIAKKVLVIVIPEHNAMSGGIYSFFSIANAAYQLRHKHDYEVVVMTRPNSAHETYYRQTNFRNSTDVFRFEQITRCKNAETVYIHIPEYAASSFVGGLDETTLEFLQTRKTLYVNILNQKTDIMPDAEDLEDLRSLSHELTQSVAHHAYFGQSYANRYDMPLLLLPAYTDLSNYPAISQAEKQKLIIYSLDESIWKASALSQLERHLPDYELREIRGITFDEYMHLATSCRYSITFGEGFDGYLAQPIYQGGVGFAVYNDEFFPSDELKGFENIFASGDDFIINIVETINQMDADPDFYERTNKRMMNVYDALYSRDDYIARVQKLINREFELRPVDSYSRSNGQ